MSIFLTQVGNVRDQNDTYDCAVSGDLTGLEPPVRIEPADGAAPVAAAPVALPVAPEPPALDAADGLAAANDDDDEDDEAALLAACANEAALLTIEVAAEMALAKFGRPLPEPDNGRTDASGDEAAAASMLDAAELDEDEPTGRVWM